MNRYDVFISYRRSNGFWMAQAIYGALKMRGVRCYLDLEEERSGEFNVALLEAIADSSYFLLILSKDALDRCENEKDWVRKEIFAALDGKKPIIPVIAEDFSWPQSETVPQAIRELHLRQGVKMQVNYFPSGIDKILNLMPSLDPNELTPMILPEKEVPRVTNVFFSRGLAADLSCLKGVDMAFHAGGQWMENSEKVELLDRLLEHKIPVRVLINTKRAAEPVCRHMRQKHRRYIGFSDVRRDWLRRAAESKGLLEVRCLKTPLLHRLYILHGEENGAVNVKYYSYGNYNPARDMRAAFPAGTADYETYRSEFEYLWKLAKKD